MKNVLLCILFLLFAGNVIAQPTIDEVVKKYFAGYDNVEAPHVLRFSKRAAGWYVSEIHYLQPNDFRNDQLFWSTAQQQYLELNYPKRTVADTSDGLNEAENYLGYYISDYDRNQFGKSLFFGYPGWDWDIIQALQNESVLADSVLENLARAYALYASGFFQDQYGFHFLNNDPDRKIINDSAAISRSRKDKYIAWERKAVETWGRLAKQNRGYTTVVGTVDIKVANEGMAAWSTLQMAGYATDAEVFIKEVKYPDSLLDKAKTYFPKAANAIFISAGDNDTYPLWYLQHSGYRKDVAVVNYSLLGLGRMLNYLSSTYKNQLFKTTRAVFLKPEMAYAWYDAGNCKQPVTIRSFLSSIKKAETYSSFPCKEVTEPINTVMAAKLFNGRALLPALKMQMPGGFFLSDYMLLDIIQTNLYTRPLYFAYPDMFRPVERYLVQEDAGYRLMPVK